MGMMLRRYHHKGTKGITTSADLGASGDPQESKRPSKSAAKTKEAAGAPDPGAMNPDLNEK